MTEAKIGVIGGSGLYEMEELTEVTEVAVKTPFGEPSGTIVVGSLAGARIAFIPRHGRGHRISPTEVPSQANIYALKSLGTEWLISVGAVGSLREEIHPIDLVIPDQLIDCTKNRVNTFFGGGMVVHVSFAEPFCPVLSQILFRAAEEVGAKVHKGGTYLVMEGPQFSTKAESHLYRSWGAHIIGMTALPEAKLAREAEICYATLSFVTDYDCWHEGYVSVTTDMVLANLKRSADLAKIAIRIATGYIPPQRQCGCAFALKDAIASVPECVPTSVKKKLALLVGKYIKPPQESLQGFPGDTGN